MQRESTKPTKPRYYSVCLDLGRRFELGSTSISRKEFIKSRLNELSKETCFLGLDEGFVHYEPKQCLQSGEVQPNNILEFPSETLAYNFYFSTKESAEKKMKEWKQNFQLDKLICIKEIEHEDWNATWREKFTGVFLPPYWEVLPVWSEKAKSDSKAKQVITMNPSLGFGTGEHDTTQLCLMEMAQKVQRGHKVLDFGSGSGILSVAGALLGASVDAVEIDAMARESSEECFNLNKCTDSVKLFADIKELGQLDRYDVIVANILADILIRECEVVLSKMKPTSVLILSGVLEEQVGEVRECYLKEFEKKGLKSNVHQATQDGWVCLCFSVSR